MKTKLLFVTLVLLALGGSLFAQVGQQGIASNPLGGDLTATSASCATVQSCVWMRLPNNGSTATVTLAGTFVQTDLIELSGDGGNTWITNATLSAVGITSVSVSGFSDIRVRCSAFTSGRASVTINVGILQVQSVVSSSSSSSPSSQLGGANVVNVSAAPYNVQTGFVVTDATITNASSTITTGANDPACTSAMATWAVFGTQSNGTGGGLLTMPEGTISSCTAHSITSSTAGNASASGTNNGVAVWGPIMDTQLTSAETAAWGATGICFPMQLPAGPVLVHSPHFGTVNCNPGIQSGQEPGAVVWGWGYKVSLIIPTPNFLINTCPAINTKLSCFGMVPGTQFREFGITGEGNGSPTQPTSATYIFSTGNDDQIWDLYLSAWGGKTGGGNLRGVFFGTNGPYPITIDVDGAGSIPCEVGGFYVVFVGSFCGDSIDDQLVVNGGAQLRDFGSTHGCAGGSAANIRVTGDYFGYGITSLTCTLNTNSYVRVGVGGNAYFDGLRWQGPTTPTTGCWANGGLLKLTNGRCIGSTNIVLRDGAAGQFIDNHDNSYAGGGVFNGTIPVLTTSGNGAIAVDGTTCFNERCNFTLTAGTTTGATPTLTYTFAGPMTEGAGTDVPACTIQLDNTGTGSWATLTAGSAMFVTARSTSAYTFQLLNNAVALTSTSTYKGHIECQRLF